MHAMNSCYSDLHKLRRPPLFVALLSESYVVWLRLRLQMLLQRESRTCPKNHLLGLIQQSTGLRALRLWPQNESGMSRVLVQPQWLQNGSVQPMLNP